MGEASRTYDDAILKMLLELCFFAPSSTQPAMANVAKLLLLQGGKCFYCGNRLALEDATIDHVLAKALGGDNSEANTVACCHSINQVFGHATPKEKLTAIINAGGRIDCPPKPAKKALPVEATIPTQEPIQPVPPAVLSVPQTDKTKNRPREKTF
ncbi:MAG: nuclease [Firmicutes bacterium]|nr:nuclease [Bacillota bacterium]